MVGRISDLIANKGSPQPGKPPGGNHLSLTANNITSKIESQNAGTAIPN